MPPNHLVLQDLLSQLQSQTIELKTLLPLLCLPLAKVNLLPPQFRKFNSLPSEDAKVEVARVFPPLQHALLESILPTWETILEEEGCSALTLQYFCPDAFLNASSVAGDVALCAYSTILSLPLPRSSVDLLLRLASEYPIDRLFHAVCTIRDPARRSLSWDDCLRNVFAVPAKIANALEGQGIPAGLGLPDYYNNLNIRTEHLIYTLSSRVVPEDLLSLLTQLFSKLAHIGAFPCSAHPSPSQSSFFRSTLSSIRRRFQEKESESYKKLWHRMIASLPSVLTQQAILASLLASLAALEPTLGISAHDRGVVRREAVLLRDIIGDLGPRDDLWNSMMSVIMARSWGENHARVFVCSLASSSHASQAQEAFLSLLVDAWSASGHIKHSLLSRHQYISTLLLLAVTHFPESSTEVTSVALSPSLVSAVGTYISHPDANVRRCGMLVAEVIASRVGKTLDFGDWEGDDDDKVWARHLRQLCSQRDIDFKPLQDHATGWNDEEPGPSRDTQVIQIPAPRQAPVARTEIPAQPVVGYDSDDSLTGYASPSSSRSPSPTPSELQEINEDPTLHVGRKKIPRPVYLAQLGELIRGGGVGSSEENQEADKIEMAINVGEELIRRKRDYGTELAENAANLVYSFISLSNKYDLDDFDNKIQRITIALVVCCPKISTQCMIEEFFKNQYSFTQRSVMLNALALGARELASLPVSSQGLQPPPAQRTAFPSTMLPPALHRRYLATSSDNVLQPLLEDITKAAIDRNQDVTAVKVPAIIRERQLRIKRPSKITEIGSAMHKSLVPSLQHRPSILSFTSIAAEWFIMPLVNQFWVFLRDEQTREERTAHRDTLYQYRGAGTGLILNSLTLSALLNTMAILVHASQNAPQWLALIAPNIMELAVTVGSRQLTRSLSEDTDNENSSPNDHQGKEAPVLTSALKLALVTLDGCIELDGGHSLGLEHTALLIGTGEWAGQVFGLLERGIRVSGVGGIHEVELRRTTAGVLLKVDQITSKWRRSMVDVS